MLSFVCVCVFVHVVCVTIMKYLEKPKQAINETKVEANTQPEIEYIIIWNAVEIHRQSQIQPSKESGANRFFFFWSLGESILLECILYELKDEATWKATKICMSALKYARRV